MKAWQDFLSQLEKTIGKKNIDEWARSLTIIKFDACNLYLEAGDSFQAQWFYEHIHPRLPHLSNNNGRLIKVHLSVKDKPDKEKKRKYIAPAYTIRPDSLHDVYQFSSYVSSEQNQLTLDFLKKLCFSKESFQEAVNTNPIYLYGSKGVGKTHVLHAIGHKLEQLGLRVFFAKAETFASHFVNAIRQNMMQLFRDSYRNIDVLIVDDVHVFSKKAATQEEFFHTFNTLHTQGKCIILSSQYTPRKLEEIEPRLISRFEWGICLKLELPSKEDLQQILTSKASALSFALSTELRQFLVNTFTSSAKSIYQAFDALVMRAYDQNLKEVSAQAASILLRDLIIEEEKNALTSEQIIRSVANHYGLKKEDLLGKAQSRDIALPRKVAVFFCRKFLKLPYQKIGKLFSRDHSTIMSSEKFIIKELEKNSREMVQNVAMISRKLDLY